MLLLRIWLGRLLVLLGLFVFLVVLATVVAFSHGFLLLLKRESGRSDTAPIRRITDSWKYERSILKFFN